jgi:hypothetical protein
MNTQPQRTDFAPPSVFRKRASWGPNMDRPNGNPFYGEEQWISIAYDSSFNLFAANAAHALRHRLFYRTDGGRFARGVVRESGDLEAIHDFLNNSAAMATGTIVPLRAVIVRRKTVRADQQWEVTVRFAMLQKNIVDEGDILITDPANIAKDRKAAFDTAIWEARRVEQDIRGKNRDIADRIGKMISIATRLGYPHGLELWHYKPSLVEQYLALATTEGRRRQMTAANGGKLPFEGHSASQAGDWRMYPFKEIIRKSAGKDEATRRIIIHNELVETDRRIFDLVRKANEAANRNGTGGGAAWGPSASRFFDHLKQMQQSTDNFLSAYAQRNQGASGGIWSTY